MFLNIKDLSFRYDNAKEQLLKDFSLQIEKGEIVALLGNSGCGKSSLLRIISGLEDRARGYISIDEKVVLNDRLSTSPERRNVGLVFQDYGLFPHMTVEKNIVYGLKKASRAEKHSRLDELMSLVNLEGLEKRYPHELSGGQQQRVALARALAPKPRLLLLDEPFSNLDASLKSKIRSELRSILKAENITSIIVTHDVEDAEAVSDRIVRMR